MRSRHTDRVIGLLFNVVNFLMALAIRMQHPLSFRRPCPFLLQLITKCVLTRAQLVGHIDVMQSKMQMDTESTRPASSPVLLRLERTR